MRHIEKRREKTIRLSKITYLRFQKPGKVKEREKMNPESTTVTQQQPSPTKKVIANKCNFGECPDRIVKIVGTCRHCSKNFCAKHRYIESHACENMINCKQEAFDKNAKKVLNEKATAQKV